MKNPFGPQDYSSYPYVNLKKRMLRLVQLAKIDDQIFQVVQKAYEDALRAENIVLSGPERKRMLSQILKAVLEDMIQKLDGRSSAS
jgi:hypothetical protein